MHFSLNIPFNYPAELDFISRILYNMLKRLTKRRKYAKRFRRKTFRKQNDEENDCKKAAFPYL